MDSTKREETLPLPPAPSVLSASGRFDGDDGQWSTFYINIGDDGSGKGQNFRVLISTSSSVTIVPGQTEWCEDDACARRRGLEIYNGEQPLGLQDSVQWKAENLYAIPMPFWWSGAYRIDQSNTSGLWGVANVGLGTSSTKSDILPDQYVVKALVKDFFIGSFGLAAGSTGTRRNFLEKYCAANKIASRSYGYTAGAYYRNNNNGVPGTLVLGGYDKARLNGQGTSVRMPNESNNTLAVGVQSVLYSMDQRIETNTRNLTPNGGFSATIDSSIPYLILPDDVCDEFVSRFGLEFDEGSQLFLVNASSHEQNQRQNANVSFNIGASSSGSADFTSIVLPYAAFYQQASFPLPVPGNITSYFSIKRSKNGRFVLGRTFLQEAYIVVDYERTNFTVAPVRFTDPMPTPSLVTIFNQSYTGLPRPGPTTISKGGLSAGAIAGIVVGVVLLFSLVGIGAFLWWRKRPDQAKDKVESEKPPEIDTTFAGTEVKHRRVSELTGSEGPQSPKDPSLGYYSPGHTSVPAISEMSPDSTPAELYSPPPEGTDGSDYFAAGDMRRQGATRERRSPTMSRPHTPIAELPGENEFSETPADGSRQSSKPPHSRSPSDNSLGTNIDTVLANERIASAKSDADTDRVLAGPSSPATVDGTAAAKAGPSEENRRTGEQPASEGRPPHARGLSDTSVQSESTAVSQPTAEELERWARPGEDAARPLSPS